MYYDNYYLEQPDYDERQMNLCMGPETEMGNIDRDAFLANDISKAIIGEVHAYYFYEALARLATNYRDRQIILEIQRDEAKHYQWFSMLLRRMERPQPNIPVGELPRGFREGVRKSINDELEANAFYRNIASRATTRPVQMRFTSASYDEANHASLYQNMLRDFQIQNQDL